MNGTDFVGGDGIFCWFFRFLKFSLSECSRSVVPSFLVSSDSWAIPRMSHFACYPTVHWTLMMGSVVDPLIHGLWQVDDYRPCWNPIGLVLLVDVLSFLFWADGLDRVPLTVVWRNHLGFFTLSLWSVCLVGSGRPVEPVLGSITGNQVKSSQYFRDLEKGALEKRYLHQIVRNRPPLCSPFFDVRNEIPSILRQFGAQCATNSPVANSHLPITYFSELIMKKLPIPLPIFILELIKV